MSECGTPTSMTCDSPPPSCRICSLACSISARCEGRFIHIATPPTCTKGNVHSASAHRCATARAVTMSNCSRHCGRRAASSARAWMNSTPSIPSSAQRGRKNRKGSWRESSRARRICGKAILSGKPGKPAPVPTSSTRAPATGCHAATSVSESRKWRTTASSGGTEVRFMCALAS
jgi:hypothetical protein